MMGASFATYLLSYMLGFHSLCLLSLVSMNLLTFQVGINYHELKIKNIHLNQFDELDESTSSESSDDLSLKQREQGATVSKSMDREQEEKLNRQLRQVVDETNIRNRKRRGFNATRTPSTSTLMDDNDSDSNDMPPPLTASEVYRSNGLWNDVPSYSQTHYLHALDDVD